MNTYDKIDLPTLPEPFTYTRPGRSEGALFHAGHMQDYVLADRKQQGEVVVTKDESGAIVAVTRQDEEGRILSVIAEADRKRRGSIVNNTSASSEPVAKVRDRGFEVVDGKHVPTVLVEFPVDDWESRDRFAAAVDTPQPVEPSKSEPRVSTTQVLITLGKVIAGYRPGEEGWSEYDQQAYDAAMTAPQSLNESDIPAEPMSRDVEALVRLLEDGEWAEHVARTPLGQRLDSAVL